MAEGAPRADAPGRAPMTLELKDRVIVALLLAFSAFNLTVGVGIESPERGGGARVGGVGEVTGGASPATRTTRATS